MIILAIETSCDETSMALVEDGKNIIELVTHTQIDTFKKYGGVVPELSSRMHVKSLPLVYQELFSRVDFTINDVDHIAVTAGPGLIGSLLSGISFAKSLSLIHQKKLLAVNHLQAHIAAINIEHEIEFPILTLVVSGGHTELVYVESFTKYTKIGSTLDDAAGESFDKVARILNIGYPGGPEIEKYAQSGETTYEFPLPKTENEFDFSFSGIKSAAFNLNNQMAMKKIEINKNDFAASFQAKIIEILITKLKSASLRYPTKQIAIVGGVSANKALTKAAKKSFDNVIVPKIDYCTDNAAMVGVRAYFLAKEEKFQNIDFNAKVNLTIEDEI